MIEQIPLSLEQAVAMAPSVPSTTTFTAYGIYIQTDDGLKTLNDFIRSVRLNHRYYFGGTVDYHA
jgi:hypothetical protein